MMRQLGTSTGVQANTPASVSVSLPRLLVWLLPQVVLLGLVVLRVPLWARFEQPGERLAVHAVLLGQLATAAMLFPLLLGNWQLLVAVVATAWVPLLTATTLAALRPAQALPAEAFVMCWLVALFTWRAALSVGENAVAVSLASIWCVGGPLLLYLRTDFAGGGEPVPTWLYGPVIQAFAMLEHPSSARAWVVVGLVAAAGTTLSALRGRLFH